MATQTKVELNGAPDVAGADTLYEGFGKLNDNMDLLASGAAVGTSGASAIGYYDGASATNVQDFLDTLSYDGTNGVTDGQNIGTGTIGESGWVYDEAGKTGNLIGFRKIVGGTNCTVSTDAATDLITINAGLANAFNVTVVDTGSTYTTLSTDEIILIDTQDSPFTLTLQAGTDQRILYIKNLAWHGTAGSETQNTTEVTINAHSAVQEYIEDDRTALPTTSTAIGPGSTMKVVFSTSLNTWSII